jgi:hypothetical protein
MRSSIYAGALAWDFVKPRPRQDKLWTNESCYLIRLRRS